MQTTEGLWRPESSATPHVGGWHLAVIRVSVAGLALTASLVGLLPAMLFLNGAWLWTIVPAASFVLMLIGAFNVTPIHLRRPAPFEVVGIWLAAISHGALVSFLALSGYLLVLAVRKVVSFLFALKSDWSGAAEVVAYVIGGFFLLGIGIVVVRGMFLALYPPVSGIGTRFRRFTSSLIGRAVLTAGLVCAIGLVIAAMTWPLSSLGVWSYFGISVVLVFLTMSPWEEIQTQVAPRTFSSNEEAVGAILRALEFTVVEQPRTGLPQIDPHLSELDFAIARGDRSFALQVLGTEGPVEPVVVSRTAIAAHALSSAARAGGDNNSMIEPVLVLIGIAPTSELLEFAVEQDVHVIYVPEGELLDAKADAAALKALGDRLFGQLLHETEPQSASFPSPEEFSLSRNRSRVS